MDYILIGLYAVVLLILTSLLGVLQMWLVYGLWPVSWGWWLTLLLVGVVIGFVSQIFKKE